MIRLNGTQRNDLSLYAVCKKWGCEYAILKRNDGELAICRKYGDNYSLTAAWSGWEKDFVTLG